MFAQLNITLGVSAASILIMMLLVWLGSLYYRDASLVDRFWGLGFIVSSVSVAYFTGATHWSRQLLLIMVLLWGLRLSIYLTQRNWGGGEDHRYVAMRKRWGAAFTWKSLYIVYGFQALLLWLVVMPVSFALVDRPPNSLHWTQGLGFMMWFAGFYFELTADTQLTRFKADPANKGKVMQTGLWRYTRHPNYFGEALLWWGVYLFVCTGDLARWTMLSPALMHFLLVRVSGVPLTEKRLRHTRPEYADYVARTSAFIPRPPKG